MVSRLLTRPGLIEIFLRMDVAQAKCLFETVRSVMPPEVYRRPLELLFKVESEFAKRVILESNMARPMLEGLLRHWDRFGVESDPDNRLRDLVCGKKEKKRKSWVKVDDALLMRSFQEALMTNEPRPSYQRIAALAYAIYCRGLSKQSPRPHARYFEQIVYDPICKPSIHKLVTESGAPKRKRNTIDEDKFFRVYQEIFDDLRLHSERVSYSAFCRMIHAAYCRDLPEFEKPIPEAFEDRIRRSSRRTEDRFALVRRFREVCR